MIVALTGFMMCGKSTYGRVAAEALCVPFSDLDDHIIEGFTPGEIIREMGEDAFREKETEALRRFLEEDNETIGTCAGKASCTGTDSARVTAILALGGGTVLREQNRMLIKKHCRVIWLKATLEDSVFNPEWAHLTASRPLLAGGNRERITRLYSSRIPIYESVADFTIDTSGKSPELVLDELIRAIGR